MERQLEKTLKVHQKSFANVTPFDLNEENVVYFDFSKNNSELSSVDLNDEISFNNYVFDKLKANKSEVGIGIYNEDREIYKRSDVFNIEDAARSIHLGIDIWAKAGTPVFCPLDGKIHSFKNNNSHGDYGPTIILEHRLDGITFYTLYGHLSLDSISDKTLGQVILKGEQFAYFGDYEVNVHWPPHLHFQIIKDMQDKFGDFPGVAPADKRDKYINLCPDPNLILGVKKLYPVG